MSEFVISLILYCFLKREKLQPDRSLNCFAFLSIPNLQGRVGFSQEGRGVPNWFPGRTERFDIKSATMPIAIVRAVSPHMAECELTHLPRQPIDIALAEKQHEEYIDALRMLGCQIETAPELPFHPDSVFVEDCAVVLDELAIIARPGVESRVGEVHTLAETLEPFRKRLYYIETPGVLDGGDVLQIGKQLWVGMSGRSNRAAYVQMQELLEPLGYTINRAGVKDCLHLKSAVTRIGPNTLLINPDRVDAALFSNFNLVETHRGEPDAANALLIGETVIFPVDYPLTALRLAEAGIDLLLVDNSEVIKAEGGVTCCSVVFE